MVFEKMRRELSELVTMVRQSERYCTIVAAQPDLATEQTHAQEIQREQRIADLSGYRGLTAQSAPLAISKT